MTPYLFAAALTVLGSAAGYLKGVRLHIAEHEQAQWVHGLSAPVPLLAIEAAPVVVTSVGLPVRGTAAAWPEVEFEVDAAVMERVLVWLQESETALTAELPALDFGMPIFAGLGPMPAEPELVGVGHG